MERGELSNERRLPDDIQEPPEWLMDLFWDHLDFGCDQEEAQIPTLGFI